MEKEQELGEERKGWSTNFEFTSKIKWILKTKKKWKLNVELTLSGGGDDGNVIGGGRFNK